MSNSQTSKDQVILVDENDREIGVMDKIEAHQMPVKLHRAISVFLFRHQHGRWQLLTQKRSSQKIVGANQWSNTVCGNVRPGESYEECAHRRLREELGIAGVELKLVTKFEYQVDCANGFGEHEIDSLFIGFFADKVSPNPVEVQDWHWIDWHDGENVTKKVSPITAWFKEFLSRPNIISGINKELSTAKK